MVAVCRTPRATQVPREAAKERPCEEISDLLHYILRDEETGELVVLYTAALGDMANQLAYAQRHEVPFQFLIGFLYEVRFERAAEKERSGGWEAWHPRSLRSGR